MAKFTFPIRLVKNLEVTLVKVAREIRRKVRITLTHILIRCIGVAKDGVDILTMNAERNPNDTESTLELLLNTLCKAF